MLGLKLKGATGDAYMRQSTRSPLTGHVRRQATTWTNSDLLSNGTLWKHDDVIEWKHFPRYWPFVWSPVNSPHKGQWRGALMFSLICVWINGWVNNREAGDLRRYRAHCDVTVMDFTEIWIRIKKSAKAVQLKFLAKNLSHYVHVSMC